MQQFISKSTAYLLTARDAAKTLAVSERTLWTLTNRGELPAVKIGRSVRYDPADLAKFINAKKERGQSE